ncbi:hypothetical protein VitviT2T_015868 [Vitis vinifera]|uniref:BRCA1-associated 2/ETP1 RRM domain-containing protein n=1 Tax=Vitis vinifera TaxID=29760 RepID=A0ABY9CPZ9_VITVI|nr:hypothetical protein VitviT2T_015868 [Vitis vinifera]
MNMEEKIEVAGKKKEEGNAPFKADEYAKASKRYEKGCRPYMCEASYRHSNCLDQFHKSLSKSPSTVLLQEEMPPSDTQSSPMATSEAMGRMLDLRVLCTRLRNDRSVDIKTDIYSFGMAPLELINGRKASDNSKESFGGLNGSLSKERPKENSFENPAPENSFAERWLWKWHLMMQTRVPVLKRREECEMQHGNLVHHRFLEIMELRLMALMVGKNAVDLESTDPLVCQSTDFQISETSGTSALQPYYPLRDLQEQPDPAKDSVKLVLVDSFGSETVTESKDDLTPKEHVYLHKKQSKHHNLSERKRKGIPKQEQSVGSDSLGYSDIPCGSYKANTSGDRHLVTLTIMSATSTSANTVAGPSPNDIFRPPSAMISGDLADDVVSNVTQLPFSSGNPRIEETRGVMHLYRDDISLSSSDLPVGRKALVCVLGVPNHMTYADFCQFCGSFIQHMLEMRIVRNDGIEDQYSILIRFDNQSSADNFCKHFNGRRFSSLEVDVCRVLFTVDVQYTGSIEHAQASPASSTEQPTCPVCLGSSLLYLFIYVLKIIGFFMVLYLPIT